MKADDVSRKTDDGFSHLRNHAGYFAISDSSLSCCSSGEFEPSSHLYGSASHLHFSSWRRWPCLRRVRHVPAQAKAS